MAIRSTIFVDSADRDDALKMLRGRLDQPMWKGWRRYGDVTVNLAKEGIGRYKYRAKVTMIRDEEEGW